MNEALSRIILKDFMRGSINHPRSIDTAGHTSCSSIHVSEPMACGALPYSDNNYRFERFHGPRQNGCTVLSWRHEP
jgi:hypothetical protein